MYPWEDNKKIKSKGDLIGAATKPIHIKHYTGDKIIGIATMHKSNAIPVFNNEAVKDLASMRRN